MGKQEEPQEPDACVGAGDGEPDGARPLRGDRELRGAGGQCERDELLYCRVDAAQFRNAIKRIEPCEGCPHWGTVTVKPWSNDLMGGYAVPMGTKAHGSVLELPKGYDATDVEFLREPYDPTCLGLEENMSDCILNPPQVRTFFTGATRDQDDHKIDPEGFLSPLVIERYCQYMHVHRKAGCTLRDSDNWQRGIPLVAYMKSLWRHFLDAWGMHRKGAADCKMEDALCAIMFNSMGYLHELLKKRLDSSLPGFESE